MKNISWTNLFDELTSIEIAKWWDNLPQPEQKNYLQEHPDSSLKFHAVPLTNKVYHGTTHAFDKFKNNSLDSDLFMPDRALGTHFAKDPEISNSFVMNSPGNWQNPNEPKNGGRIIPAVIPEDEHFLQVDQPLYDWAKDSDPSVNLQGKVETDQNAIAKAVSKVAHRKHPTSLAKFLETRGKNSKAAQREAKILQAGGKVADVGGNEYDLDGFIDNHTGAFPYNKNIRKQMVNTARKHWQSQGYKGLKYINTSPSEMEKAKDPTCYIVFDPRHIRSRFAKFKTANRNDLLANLENGAEF